MTAAYRKDFASFSTNLIAMRRGGAEPEGAKAGKWLGGWPRRAGGSSPPWPSLSCDRASARDFMGVG